MFPYYSILENLFKRSSSTFLLIPHFTDLDLECSEDGRGCISYGEKKPGGYHWASELCHFDYRCKAFKFGIDDTATNFIDHNYFCTSDTTYDEPTFKTCTLNEGLLLFFDNELV